MNNEKKDDSNDEEEIIDGSNAFQNLENNLKNFEKDFNIDEEINIIKNNKNQTKKSFQNDKILFNILNYLDISKLLILSKTSKRIRKLLSYSKEYFMFSQNFRNIIEYLLNNEIMSVNEINSNIISIPFYRKALKKFTNIQKEFFNFLVGYNKIKKLNISIDDSLPIDLLKMIKKNGIEKEICLNFNVIDIEELPSSKNLFFDIPSIKKINLKLMGFDNDLYWSNDIKEYIKNLLNRIDWKYVNKITLLSNSSVFLNYFCKKLLSNKIINYKYVKLDASVFLCDCDEFYKFLENDKILEKIKIKNLILDNKDIEKLKKILDSKNNFSSFKYIEHEIYFINGNFENIYKRNEKLNLSYFLILLENKFEKLEEFTYNSQRKIKFKDNFHFTNYSKLKEKKYVDDNIKDLDDSELSIEEIMEKNIENPNKNLLLTSEEKKYNLINSKNVPKKSSKLKILKFYPSNKDNVTFNFIIDLIKQNKNIEKLTIDLTFVLEKYIEHFENFIKEISNLNNLKELKIFGNLNYDETKIISNNLICKNLEKLKINHEISLNYSNLFNNNLKLNKIDFYLYIQSYENLGEDGIEENDISSFLMLRNFEEICLTNYRNINFDFLQKSKNLKILRIIQVDLKRDDIDKFTQAIMIKNLPNLTLLEILYNLDVERLPKKIIKDLNESLFILKTRGLKNESFRWNIKKFTKNPEYAEGMEKINKFNSSNLLPAAS